MAREYRVKWEIDLQADSADDAAQKALEIQRDPQSIATVFVVRLHRTDRTWGHGQTVDLSKPS